MANILDIRRRIRSVINTRQITKAMKMMSAARLRRAQDRTLAARPYAQMITNVLQSLVRRTDLYDPDTGQPRHPLLDQRQEKRVLLVLISGDKGLAGAFNSNILRAASRFIQQKSSEGKTVDIEAIGRKGRDFYKRRYPVADLTAEQRKAEIQLVGERVGILTKFEFRDAAELANNIIQRYSDSQIDAVYFIYNEFKSVIAQRLVIERILPIKAIGEPDIASAEDMTQKDRRREAEAAESAGVSIHAADTTEMDRKAAEFATKPLDYIYEQSPEELFASLLPKYVEVQMFRAMLESSAAEHAARMTAMDSATNNASEMIDSLTLAMNRVRQAKITKEIIEIVSGAAAAQ